VKPWRIVFVAGALVRIGALVPVSSCVCPDPVPTFHDDFSSDCGATPCGYTVVHGPVERVATYHDGVHGVSLSADAEIMRPLPPMSLRLAMLERCDASAKLQVAHTDASGVGAIWIDVPPAPSDAPPFARVEIDVESLDGPLDAGTDASSDAVSDAGAGGPIFLAFRAIGGTCILADVYSYAPAVCLG